MVKVGVIGVGYLGQHHARILSAIHGVKLAAVIDIDREQVAKIGQQYECDAYTDFRDALDKADAFSIVTPTIAHHAIAKECIDAGKDILVEKPFTCATEEADELIEAAERAGVIVQVGHLERFNPAIMAIYPLIDNPRFFEAERLSPFLGRGTDVDITLDLMIHDIDIILALLSRRERDISVKDAKTIVARVLTDKVDVAKVWLEFHNGVQALMTASRVSFEKSRKLKIFQKDSYFLVDYQNMEVKRFFKEGNKLNYEPIMVEKKEPLKEELKSFVESLITRRPPVVSAKDGRNALKVALQIGEQMNKKIGCFMS